MEGRTVSAATSSSAPKLGSGGCGASSSSSASASEGLDSSRSTSAASASLLNNFEIVATAVIALMVFKEKISARLWGGIVTVTLSCLLLSFEDITSLTFSRGSLLILLAAVAWGFENNCTRKISSKDPLEIVLLKGIFSGTGIPSMPRCPYPHL